MLNTKKVVSLLLVVVMMLTANVTVFAQGSITPQANPTPVTVKSIGNLSNVSYAEIEAAKAKGLKIINKITDPAEIKARVADGSSELQDGKLPTSITTYMAIDNNDNSLAGKDKVVMASSGLSVKKTRYYDGQYFDDYDRYKVDGPSTFTVTYEKEGTRNWNTSMSGSVEVGGSIYKVADVKAAVSSKVGYSFGEKETKSQEYEVDIPKGKYWVIKVWVSYLVYEYEVSVGSTKITTGYTWHPNGLIIESSEYDKDK